MRIDRVEFLVLNVSEKTNWSFVRVTSEAGVTGIGEASLNGWESAQQAYAGDLERQLAESPLYYDIVGGYQPKLVDGCFELPDAAGIGVELDDAVLRAHAYRPLAPNANLDARLG